MNFYPFFFKYSAEEFSKFAFPVSEVVFRGLLPAKEKEEWACIARLEEFIQNHARNGWSEEDAQTFHEMALRYAVLLEERRGPTACVMILHNLLHFKDDIRKFSGLDNYSCWTKERAVRRYVKQSSNCKNIECTFAASESRREFIKMKSEQEGQACNPRCVNEQLVGIHFCISNLNSSVLKDMFSKMIKYGHYFE